MKQIILFIVLGVLANMASAQKYSFMLKGDIINVKDGKVQLYSPTDSVNVLLTTEMKNGLFTLTGELDEPGLYALVVKDVVFPIVLDGKEMTLYGDYLEPDTKLLKGSAGVKTRLALDQLYYESSELMINEALEKYYQMKASGKQDEEQGMVFMGKAIREATSNWRVRFLDFVKEHPDDLYVPVRAMEEMGKEVKWGKEVYDLLTPEIQASQPGRLLKERLQAGASDL